ncbi:unnamed protein product, partial [Laminaria digitata]
NKSSSSIDVAGRGRGVELPPEWRMPKGWLESAAAAATGGSSRGGGSGGSGSGGGGGGRVSPNFSGKVGATTVGDALRARVEGLPPPLTVSERSGYGHEGERDEDDDMSGAATGGGGGAFGNATSSVASGRTCRSGSAASDDRGSTAFAGDSEDGGSMFGDSGSVTGSVAGSVTESA